MVLPASVVPSPQQVWFAVMEAALLAVAVVSPKLEGWRLVYRLEFARPSGLHVHAVVIWRHGA